MKVIIYYSNGTHDEHTFDSKKEFDWFLYREGDHVIDYQILRPIL